MHRSFASATRPCSRPGRPRARVSISRRAQGALTQRMRTLQRVRRRRWSHRPRARSPSGTAEAQAVASTPTLAAGSCFGTEAGQRCSTRKWIISPTTQTKGSSGGDHGRCAQCIVTPYASVTVAYVQMRQNCQWSKLEHYSRLTKSRLNRAGSQIIRNFSLPFRLRSSCCALAAQITLPVSGQVRFITRPKSRTMKAKRQLMPDLPRRCWRPDPQ